MGTIYLILVIVLFALAISDLVVGVSNDAVNFLNSAIGSKVAPLKVILLIAAIGIVVGATFSTGMMEVARKGIFHPQHFYFSEIIIIFLAVMITDVILLDTFNTFGMPTSTTVSIVFELLGAAVAISMIKVYTDPNALDISQYINSAKALAIISGILLSVIIAFTVGALVQYLARMLFTFNFKRNLKYFGAIWGGISITAITYFMLIKGAKEASFMSEVTKTYIDQHAFGIIVYGFLGWTIILQLFAWLTRLNILKFIVLVGTFALAMAFAGNDLVNFIGVPLAGFEAYKSFIANPGADPHLFFMKDLAGAVKTPGFFLLLAGLIMVLTLWFSKKARSVTKTEINLARQDAGYERFGSSILARSIVRLTNNMTHSVNSVVPSAVKTRIDKRFNQVDYRKQQRAMGKDAPYFDLIRASVNLVVASVLIAFATSLKLPLSTTYVTFMVAMGTSLSDRAWGRESAVYRITGVFSVIGGWFFTAFSAFTVAFIIAVIINYGGIVAIIILLGLALVFVYRSHILHKKRYDEAEALENVSEELIDGLKIADRASAEIVQTLTRFSDILGTAIEGLSKEDLKMLRKAYKDLEKTSKKTKDLKNNISETINHLEENSVETGHYYVQVLDYLREINHSINFIVKPGLDHVDNNHKSFIPMQVEELFDMTRMIREIISEINQTIKTGNYENVGDHILKQQKIIRFIDTSRKKQVKRIKANEVGTRNSMLFLNILSESRSLLLHLINLLKAQRDFSALVNDESREAISAKPAPELNN